jgi:hypothetical protein
MYRYFLLITLVLLSGISLTTAQSDSPPPYLYYYSRMLGGIIVERADGTDSRLIGADAIPPGMSGIGGAGWSPSGRFFAAFGVHYDAYTSSTGAPLLMTADGEPLIPSLSVAGLVERMEWSPDERDLLLVVTNIGYRGTKYFFMLVDPVKEQVITEFGASLTMYPYGHYVTDLTWDMTEKRVVFYYTLETFPDQFYRVSLYFDGTVLKEPVTADEFLPHRSESAFETDDNVYREYGLSPSGRYEVADQSNLLHDNELDIEIPLPRHSQGTTCRAYHWSADEGYIITLDGTLVAGGGCAGAVLGITDSQASFWRELGGCSWDVPPCVDWLPAQVDPDSLPPGQPQPIQLDPVAYEFTEQPNFGTIIPEDVQFHLRCEVGGENFIPRILDALSGDELFILSDDEPCPYNWRERYPDDMQPLIAAYDPVNHLWVMSNGYSGNGVSVWKICDEVGIPIKRLSTSGYELEFTPDGLRLRSRNALAWEIFDVADILRTAEANCP